MPFPCAEHDETCMACPNLKCEGDCFDRAGNKKPYKEDGGLGNSEENECEKCGKKYSGEALIIEGHTFCQSCHTVLGLMLWAKQESGGFGN